MIQGNVYKESEYQQYQHQNPAQPEVNAQTVATKFITSFGEVRQDFIRFGDAMADFPWRSALTVVGTVAVLYTGFRLVSNFGSIGSELTKKLRS